MKLLEHLTEHQKYKIKIKIVILIFALQNAAEKKIQRKHWGNEAIAKANTIGFTAIKNPQTIKQWWQLTSGTLPGKHNLPPFLQAAAPDDDQYENDKNAFGRIWLKGDANKYYIPMDERPQIKIRGEK